MGSREGRSSINPNSISQFDPSSSVSAIFSELRSTGAGKFLLKVLGYPSPTYELGGRGKKEENEEEKEKWKEIICVVDGDFVFTVKKLSLPLLLTSAFTGMDFWVLTPLYFYYYFDTFRRRVIFIRKRVKNTFELFEKI